MGRRKYPMTVKELASEAEGFPVEWNSAELARAYTYLTRNFDKTGGWFWEVTKEMRDGYMKYHRDRFAR